MVSLSRLGGVQRPAAWAALLLIAAGCTSNAGGPATPTSGASVSTPEATAPASATAAPSSAAPMQTATGEGVELDVRDFTLEPLDLTVDGPDVALDVTNGGPTVHNVTIRDGSGTVVGATRDLRENESETLAASLAPGHYVLFCSLPGHESLGIKGTLTVEAP